MITIFIIHPSAGLAVLLGLLVLAGGAWAEEAPGRESPRLVRFVEARYPEAARQAGLEARVPLRLRLDVEGRVLEAEGVEPVGHGFDEAAREAVLAMRFSPAMRDGKPKPSRLVYTYVFQLPARAVPVAAAPQAPVLVPEPQDAIEVFVQGPSQAQRLRQSSEAVQVVETGNIQREAADLGEAMARTEGVGVRRAGGLGSRSRFSLAGLTDEQIRFFVDGVPLYLAGYGPELANVPVNLVQRVEVYQGVVPTRFGTDALGGAVQLVTDQRVEGTGAAVSYELGSFDTHRLTLGVRHLHAPSGLFVRANAFFDRTLNDYLVTAPVADTRGRLTTARVHRFHDGYGAQGASVEAGVVDKPWAQRLLLRAFVHANGKQVQNGPTMNKVYGEVTSGESSAGLIARYSHVPVPGLTVDAIAGYNLRRTRLDDVGTCTYDWYGRCTVEDPNSPGEIGASAVQQRVVQHTGFARVDAGWIPASGHRLTLSLAPTLVGRTGENLWLRGGTEVDPLLPRRDLVSTVTGLEYARVAFQERLENVLFLKDYYQHAQAQKLLPSQVFTPVDRTLHGLGVGDSVRWRLRPGLLTKASYEYATRLPRPDEIFGDGVLVHDNLDLVPERSHNANLELLLEDTPTSSGTWRGRVLGFGRLADNLILLLGRDSYFTYQNVYAARSLGVSGALGWTSPGDWLVLDGNATWQDFRNVSDSGGFASFSGQRIPNRPYLQANGTARLQARDVFSAGDELSLTWHVRYLHAFFRGWESAGQLDSKQVIASQLLHSLALSQVSRREGVSLGWTVDVQNVTNAPAFDFFGVQRPGRSVFAKLLVEH